jgi:hypothetical protein
MIFEMEFKPKDAKLHWYQWRLLFGENHTLEIDVFSYNLEHAQNRATQYVESMAANHVEISSNLNGLLSQVKSQKPLIMECGWDTGRITLIKSKPKSGEE